MMLRRLVGQLASRLAAAVGSDRSTGGSASKSSGRRRATGGQAASGRAAEQESKGRLSDRGQSELVGTVLILGLSMAVIGTSVGLGGVALADLVSTAEADNAENGLSHLSSKVSLVALGDADSQRFSLGLMREGTVSVQPEAGSITISNVTDDSRTELFESELGAIVYAGESREVAYQGGGIWTKDGDTSRLSSPPEYHYRGTTLTLPIIQVSGEGAVGGQPSGRITPVDVATDAIPDVSTPLENGTIEVKIQSEYYHGWDEYLSQRTEGETKVYHSNQTVVSRLTVPDRVAFDTALSVSGPYDPKNAEVDSVEDNVAHRSAKPLIERRVSEANESDVSSGCLGSGSCELDAGTYFYDEDLALSDDLDLDTSSGNITIIVDGSFDINDRDVTVTDNSTPENGVTYYVDGSLRAQGNGFVGTDDPDVPDDRPVPEADRNVFYVADGFLDDSSGGGTIRFDAVVYAPDAVLNIAGTPDFTGALVVDRVEKLKGASKVEYDSSLSGTTIELTGAADLLKYLHVSHNEVRVDLD
ncbi:DUF7289 family protein [Halohasta litorea]|uniref:DUF7305 domain-containing protein n=1 Tax=Halohasta litorea TaxID=869891 RepID=A0ABD6D501_9EURY|nr:hypothetical protein [Halohasta litorea]